MASDEFPGTILLTGTAEREGNQFVSYCRETGTSSCGDTAEGAFENLGDAIEVHLNALEETGELRAFLRERNINIILPPPDELTMTVPITVGTIYKTYRHDVSAVPA